MVDGHLVSEVAGVTISNAWRTFFPEVEPGLTGV
jgi:hypothetical protein